MARGEPSCHEESPMCEHGYIPSSCAECRRAAAADPLARLYEENLAAHQDGNRAGWLTRRSEVHGRLAELEGYARRSNAQDEELHRLTSELAVLGSLIDQDDVAQRAENIEHIKRLAADPANCERIDGAPAVVKGLGDRAETAAETLQRMRSNPWCAEDGGPLAGHTSHGRMETGRGLI